MYALIACFDKQTENMICGIWKELADEKISNYAKKVKNRSPHLTLASYDQLDLGDYLPMLKKFCQSHTKLKVEFSSVGTFLQSSTLFLTPCMTRDLFDFHHALHANFENLKLSHVSLYQPDRWQPHVTLANYLSSQYLMLAYNWCLSHLSPFSGMIDRLILIKIISYHEIEEVCTIGLQENTDKC